jgi:hypothetical protein
MKKHFSLMFDASHRWWTIAFFILSDLLFVGSFILTVPDNPPGLISLYGGVCFLFLAFVHVWRKPAPFLILAGVCFVLMMMIFGGLMIADSISPKVPGLHSTEAENIIGAALFVTILFFCIPGTAIGVIGGIVTSVIRKKPEV